MDEWCFRPQICEAILGRGQCANEMKFVMNQVLGGILQSEVRLECRLMQVFRTAGQQVKRSILHQGHDSEQNSFH